MYDVAVIGGGVVGGLILRELSRYELSVCMLEKEADVSLGASRANTGIVHAGFDAEPNTLKARFNVLGAKLMPKLTSELGVKYVNNGALVVGFNSADKKTLEELYNRGKINGVKEIELIGEKKLKTLEPNISKNAKFALYAKSAGIVCPYELTIAAIGNAMDNGAELKTRFEVVKIESSQNGNFKIVSKTGETIEAKTVINAAGIFADKIANMIGDFSFKIGARKGEYILLDKESQGLVNHTLFFCPSEKGKGIVVTKTVDNNILLGPTSNNTEDKLSKATTAEGLAEVMQKAFIMTEKTPFYNTITSFAGIRAYSDRRDFIIENSKQNVNFINVAGIESPGLTSAPAIAENVIKLVAKFRFMKNKENFNPIRKADYFFKTLSLEEKNKIIEKDESYGKIICRCEEITLGEILSAIRENPKATTVDGIKRRVRAGMGRCQGGFCQPNIVKILSEELNIPILEVTKSGGKSYVNVGETK